MVTIDQSGKLEDTAVDTVLALSNHVKYSIKIKAVDKRRLVTRMRSLGYRAKETTIVLFAIGLFLLVKNSLPKLRSVMIDTEYSGHDRNIRLILLNLLASHAITELDISFMQIGKRNGAHLLALGVYRKRIKANRVVGYEEMVSYLPQKRSGTVK